MKNTLLAAALAAGVVGFAKAEDRAWAWSPLGVGIAAPLQLPFVDSDVYGLRFGGFFGWNTAVYGLDLGVAELETAGFAGVQCSAFSWTGENAYGIQIAPVANVVDGDVYGLQASAVNVDWGDVWGLQLGIVGHCNSMHGVQFGGFNWNNTPSQGWQVAAANANQEDFSGFTVGAVNYSLRMVGCQIGIVNVVDGATGCQIGVVNAVQRMRGVQIGVVNLICDGQLPIMVIANASF